MGVCSRRDQRPGPVMWFMGMCLVAGSLSACDGIVTSSSGNLPTVVAASGTACTPWPDCARELTQAEQDAWENTLDQIEAAGCDAMASWLRSVRVMAYDEYDGYWAWTHFAGTDSATVAFHKDNWPFGELENSGRHECGHEDLNDPDDEAGADQYMTSCDGGQN